MISILNMSFGVVSPCADGTLLSQYWLSSEPKHKQKILAILDSIKKGQYPKEV